MNIKFQISNFKYQISTNKERIGNWRLQIGNSPRGFTLVELVVIVALFAATGTVIVSIIFATLRASSKSDRLVSLKQNGNNALSQIVKQVRYAKSLDSACSAVDGPIAIRSLSDNSKTTFVCSTGSTGTIASNGASLVDTNAVTVTQCSFTCSQASPDDPPTINFSFTLDSKNAGNLVEATGSIPFQTSVTLRNSSK